MISRIGLFFSTASAAFYWTKYSLNRWGNPTCECRRVSFETPYGTEKSCYNAYRSTGVGGDICERRYPTEMDKEIPIPDVGDRLISRGVHVGPKYQPEQSETCHDLIHYVNKQRSNRETKLNRSNVLVHKADKSTMSCQMYGYKRPLCEPRRACLVLSYEEPSVVEYVVEEDEAPSATEVVEQAAWGVNEDVPEGLEVPEGGDDNYSDSYEEEMLESPEGTALDANDEDQENTYIAVSGSVSFGLIGLLFMAMY